MILKSANVLPSLEHLKCIASLFSFFQVFSDMIVCSHLKKKQTKKLFDTGFHSLKS